MATSKLVSFEMFEAPSQLPEPDSKYQLAFPLPVELASSKLPLAPVPLLPLALPLANSESNSPSPLPLSELSITSHSASVSLPDDQLDSFVAVHELDEYCSNPEAEAEFVSMSSQLAELDSECHDDDRSGSNPLDPEPELEAQSVLESAKDPDPESDSRSDAKLPEPEFELNSSNTAS
jgi:hypothetical protein